MKIATVLEDKIACFKESHAYLRWDAFIERDNKTYLITRPFLDQLGPAYLNQVYVTDAQLNKAETFRLFPHPTKIGFSVIGVDVAQLKPILTVLQRKILLDFLNELHGDFANLIWTSIVGQIKIAYVGKISCESDFDKIENELHHRWCDKAKVCGMTPALIEKFQKNLSSEYKFPNSNWGIYFMLNLSNDEFRKELLHVAQNYAQKKASISQAFTETAVDAFLNQVLEKNLNLTGNYYPVTQCLAGFFNKKAAVNLAALQKEMHVAAITAKQEKERDAFQLNM